MIGHGSPVLRSESTFHRNSRACSRTATWLSALAVRFDALGHFIPLQRIVIVFAALFFGTVLSFSSDCHSQTPSNDLTINANTESGNRQLGLRISWGGGLEVKWRGFIQSTSGPLTNVRPLGLTYDTPGSVYLDQGNVYIDQPSATAYGGAEVFLDYQPGAELVVVFEDPANPDSRFQQRISVDTLFDDVFSKELDSNENRLTIARSPGDRLKLIFDRDHLVFETGESFPVQIQPNFSGLGSQRIRCKASLVPARSSGPALWNTTLEFELDELGNAEAQPLLVPIPEYEGVYDLRLQAEPRSITGRINNPTPVSRSLQFVALSPQPLKPSGQLWREQGRIDPTQVRPNKAIQWSQLLQATGLRGSTLSHSKRLQVDVDGKKLVQLQPGGWQAIPIRVNANGKPVLLEIEYLATEGSALGFSVLQPDANGVIPTYGFDSGVITSKTFSMEYKKAPEIERHQVLFWPESNQVYLMVANRSNSTAGTFGQIRILAGPDRLAADTHLPDSGLRERRRQLMAFYESPMFPENFGAGEVYEPTIDQTLDDWVTFYLGADRLIQYLKANGYTGTMLTVAAESGSIYPSELLSATPIFDSGVFFASGQDPIRKDILELLFRMFDREGLTLVPALALSSPLPELEEKIRQNGVEGYRPVDFRGFTPTRNKSTPTYNPLNPEVQLGVAQVVQELARRYDAHDAFQGISLLCRPDTYTQLSGRKWGYDSPTVTQFLNDSGAVQLVSGISNDWSQVQSFLLGTNQEQWLKWRANQMSQWYQQLYSIIANGRTDRRLYLSAIDIYRHPDIVSSLSPSLHWSNQFAEAMLELGWNPDDLKNDPSIVLLKPRRIDHNRTLAANKVEIQVEQSNQAKDFFRRQTITGELFTHRTLWANFSEFQSQVGMGTSEIPLLRLQQLTPTDWQNRKRFAESLRQLDSRLMIDGGWLLTTGQELSLVDLIDVYTRLPDLPFDDVAVRNANSNSSPIATRQALTDGRWYFYSVNDSPWPVEVRLNLNRGEVVKFESLSATLVRVEEEGGNRFVRLELPPYSVVGGFSEDVGTQIIDFDFAISDAAASRMKNRLNQLQLRLIQATNIKPLNAIENPGFEAGAPENIEGWSFDQTSRDDFQVRSLDRENSALWMKSDQGSNWIRSTSFIVPETGRLSISVWLRTDQSNQQPPLRVAVESENSGYYRFGSIGSLAPNDPANQVGAIWRQYVVHFDDLPVEDETRLRIGFDMMGPGQVMIDRIQLYDRLFDANDIQALTQRLGAATPLTGNSNDYELCRRILNGYWLRFLNDYIGASDQRSVENKSRAGELFVEQEPAARTSSIFERFRNVVTPRLNRR